MLNMLMITGFSGCGKSYLQESLVKIYPNMYTFPDYTIVDRILRPDDPDFYKSSFDIDESFKKATAHMKVVNLTSFGNSVYYSLIDESRLAEEGKVLVLVSTPEAIQTQLASMLLDSFETNHLINSSLHIVSYYTYSNARLAMSPRFKLRNLNEEQSKVKLLINEFSSTKFFKLLTKKGIANSIIHTPVLLTANNPYGFHSTNETFFTLDIVHDTQLAFNELNRVDNV
jgi:energy-coupling factor transporter ATP-binding protein EcfA2